MNEPFKLSYPVWTVNWDGKNVCKFSIEKIREQLALMNRLGIEEVMLTGYHIEEPCDFDPDVETKMIGEELKKFGIKPNQHHSLAPTVAEPGKDQSEVIEHIKRCIDFTANLNCDAMILHVGRPLGKFGPGEDEKLMQSYYKQYGIDAVIEQTAKNLRAAADYAQDKNVFICIENLGGKMNSIHGFHYLPKIVEQADHDNVVFCLDAGHAWFGGVDPALWVPVMGKKLYVMHLHDNHGNLDEHLSPGFGTINWTSLIRALWNEHYTRTVNFEVNGWFGMEPEEGHRHAINFWRTMEKIAAKPEKHPWE